MAKDKSPSLPPAQSDSGVATLPTPTPENQPQSTSIAKAQPKQLDSGLILSLQKNENVIASKFAACKPDNAIIEAMEANGPDGQGFSLQDLPKAKIPSGGGSNWILSSITGESMQKEIKGVLVYYGLAGTLWAHDVSKEGSKPLLVTHDLKTAVQISDDFGDRDQEEVEKSFVRKDEVTGKKYYDWTTLSYNQWGSGKNGGKVCKEQRLLCVLPEDAIAPIFVRVPPTSVNVVKTFIRQAVIQNQLPHYRIVVSLTLKEELSTDGVKYSEVAITFVDKVSKEEGQLFKALYTDALNGAMSEAVVSQE